MRISRFMPRSTLLPGLFVATLLGGTTPVLAADYSLAIQPVLSVERTTEVYAPLAEYLSERTGHNVHIEVSRDFYSYWTRVNREEFDFVLDAAHFTGYRAKNQAYHVIAAIPDTVSYTLVSAQDNLVFSADELVGKPVATMGPPSLGAIRLEQLFNNPMREPLLRTVNTATDAIDMVRDGRAVAAMVPTPMVAQYRDLNSILVTEPTPHLAVSASPHVPMDVRVAVQGALIRMSNDPRGNEVLTEMRIGGFEPANATRYLDYAALIENSRSQLRLNTATIPTPPAKGIALAPPAE